MPLEGALARPCREAGARVARNVRLADMNLDVPVQGAGRIEVLQRLPLWHGEQLAVDATLVSPRGRDTEASISLEAPTPTQAGGDEGLRGQQRRARGPRLTRGRARRPMREVCSRCMVKCLSQAESLD